MVHKAGAYLLFIKTQLTINETIKRKSAPSTCEEKNQSLMLVAVKLAGRYGLRYDENTIIAEIKNPIIKIITKAIPNPLFQEVRSFPINPVITNIKNRHMRRTANQGTIFKI